jgi:hypothetical protein
MQQCAWQGFTTLAEGGMMPVDLRQYSFDQDHLGEADYGIVIVQFNVVLLSGHAKSDDVVQRRGRRQLAAVHIAGLVRRAKSCR